MWTICIQDTFVGTSKSEITSLRGGSTEFNQLYKGDKLLDMIQRRLFKYIISSIENTVIRPSNLLSQHIEFWRTAPTVALVTADSKTRSPEQTIHEVSYDSWGESCAAEVSVIYQS